MEMLDDWRLAFCHNGGHFTRECGGLNGVLGRRRFKERVTKPVLKAFKGTSCMPM